MLQAARIITRTARDDMRAAVERLPAEGVNWRPPGDATNSIGVLANHAWQSTLTWFAVAVGEEAPKRERAAEFEVKYGSAEDLIAEIEHVCDECLALISKERGVIDWSEPRRHWDPETKIELTAAWTLLHPLEHLREHVGHIGLTRQLWEARNS